MQAIELKQVGNATADATQEEVKQEETVNTDASANASANTEVKEEGKKRINPFNKEAQAGLLIKPRESIQNKINEILKKGMYATEEESYQLNKLLGEQNIIRRGLSPEAVTERAFSASIKSEVIRTFRPNSAAATATIKTTAAPDMSLFIGAIKS